MAGGSARARAQRSPGVGDGDGWRHLGLGLASIHVPWAITLENHRKIIGTNTKIIIASFAYFIVKMCLHNIFDILIDFFRLDLVS